MTSHPPFVRAADLGKSYSQAGERVRVLHGLDLTLERGEILAVVGVSGTGKSTLLNLLGGIDRPDEGRLTVGGRELSGAGDGELTRYRRDQVGFVFQFYNLVPTLTTLENVLASVEAQGRRNRSDGARARDLLAEVGLESKADLFPEQLSGGEQQRVAIARAVIKAPPLLLADEPTGNLDPATGRDVLELLAGSARKSETAAVLVSHDPLVRRFADRTLILRDGRLGVPDSPDSPDSPDFDTGTGDT
ncbi:MAG: ABC transporter ATP-binding protein [Acidobacteriota bacterium]|jgi:putative ABC transport system ATP-binding protein